MKDPTQCTILERRFLEATLRVRRISRRIRHENVGEKLERAMNAQHRALMAFLKERGL